LTLTYRKNILNRFKTNLPENTFDISRLFCSWIHFNRRSQEIG